jgi:hypothetical protein
MIPRANSTPPGSNSDTTACAGKDPSILTCGREREREREDSEKEKGGWMGEGRVIMTKRKQECERGGDACASGESVAECQL